MSSKGKSFSERYGYTEPKPPQIEGMDSDLRTGLWNVFDWTVLHPDVWGWERHKPDDACREIFANFLKKPRDEYDYYQCVKSIKSIFLNEKWYEVYNLIEFVIGHHSSIYVDRCNEVLESENSAHRIVGKYVAPITSELDVGAVETVMQAQFEGARECIENALRFFSDRETPDYKNSIAESIHAVESIAQEVTGKEKSLNAMTQSLKLHANLTNALNELYDWTSKDGIRHGKSGKPLRVDQDTARFMLVTCSAFVNYIAAKNSKGAR